MARLANLAQQHFGVDGVTVPDLVDLLAEELETERRNSFGSVEDDAELVKMLGPDVAERVRRHYANQVKAEGAKRLKAVETPRAQPRDSGGRYTAQPKSRIARGQAFRDKLGIM